MALVVLRKVLSLLMAGAVLSMTAGSAAAQVPRCALRDDMVSTLSEAFSEKQHAYGQLSPQLIIEVFVSDKGGWTIVVTGADGISCVLAVGTGWETLQAFVGENAGARAGKSALAGPGG
jgi:hypothetical protein